MTVTRLGAVSFLNTQPLIWGIDHALFPGRFALRRDVPSRCADQLRSGDVDLALVPSIEFARLALARGGPALAAVPGLCIASDGPAESVLLFSPHPPERVRSVGVDAASRTSVALLRILFRERFGCEPAFTETPEELAESLGRFDAALVIGDRALFADRAALRARGVAMTDLGAEWKALTGLPFVFAFWAGRADAAGPETVGALHRSLRFGLSRLPDIAASWRWQGTPRPEIAFPYLRDVMRYELGQRERDGLLRFYLLAARHGLIADVPELALVPPSASMAG